MKKIITIGCLLCTLSMGAFAQEFRTWDSFHEGHKNRSNLLDRALDYLFAPRPAKLPWVKAVENQVHKATPRNGIIGGIITDYVNYQPRVSLTQVQAARISPAVESWNEALKKNRSVLNRFHVKVVRSQDIMALSEQEVKQIKSFLTGTVNVSADVEEYQHYMVRTTLQGEQPIHLLFNCYFKEIYVIRGNTKLANVPLEKLPVKRTMR